MWNTFSKVKDNIKSIAADVLEAPEDEDSFENNDFLSPGLDYLVDKRIETDRTGELQWYKDEVKRLQSGESDIQTLSKNYVTALKEKELECHALRQQNEALKNQLLVKPEISDHGKEISDLREKVKSLQDELHQTINNHQEQVVALQDSHRKRTDVLFARHRREIESLQSQLSAGKDRNETDASFGNKVQALEQQLVQLQEKEKEYARQLAEKHQSYISLKMSFEQAGAELASLKDSLEKETAAKQELEMRLRDATESADAALAELNNLRTQKQAAAEELAEAERRLLTSAADASTQIAALKAEKEAAEEAARASQEKLSLLEGSGGSDDSVAAELRREVDRRKDELESAALRLAEANAAAERQRSEFDAELAQTRADKDKAVRDLQRLKQHLLEMETVESEKMELELQKMANLESRVQGHENEIRKLLEALDATKAELASERSRGNEGLRSHHEENEGLRSEVDRLKLVLESKNVELNNLQIALGQYYAESEAQERLQVELTSSKEAVSRLQKEVQLLRVELAEKEEQKQVALQEAQEASRKLQEGLEGSRKVQEDVALLRRALEQSMIRITRMSTDSDFYVDRRLVSNLLVTYFQKNHSQEVLDLMARILGFSDEEKAKIGLAQRNSGVVKGVLGLSGRFMGGFLRNVAPDSESSEVPDGSTSFSDLWIDFLLKESEERERREKAGNGEGQETHESKRPAIPTSPRTPNQNKFNPSFLSSSSTSPPPFNGNLSPRRAPLDSPYSLNASPGKKSTSFSDMPNPLATPDEYVYPSGSQSHGLFSDARTTVSRSPLSEADAAFINGGEFSAVPLNNATPTSSPLAGPAGKAKSVLKLMYD